MEKKQRKSKTPYIIFAIAALAILLLLLTIIYYSVLKPQQPELAINEVVLENSNNGAQNTARTQNLQGVTLRMKMTLHNPNKGTFYYANVGVTMSYRGKELGYGLVPGGKVKGGGRSGVAVYVAAMEPAAGFAEAMALEGEVGRPEMVTVKMDLNLAGDVTVLGSFSHHASISTSCFVSISSVSLEVITFICGVHSYENYK
ncbi:hypothetical protein L7F22_026065 [Adiantum nelumboides]|nr:hypothetical protein [Adiantum nelumboides]